MSNNVPASQIEKWKDKIKQYKDTIFGMYGKYPSEKLIESFCKIYNIPYPLPHTEEAEEDWDFLN